MDPKVANEVKKHFMHAQGAISMTMGAKSLSKRWICNACKKVITGSNTKLKAHLLAIVM